MEEKKECCKIKGFFKRLFGKVDRKLEKKAKESGCGCQGGQSPKSSCCK
jgi:hypothetical protein